MRVLSLSSSSSFLRASTRRQIKAVGNFSPRRFFLSAVCFCGGNQLSDSRRETFRRDEQRIKANSKKEDECNLLDCFLFNPKIVFSVGVSAILIY